MRKSSKSGWLQYRETIRSPGTGVGRVIRQAAGGEYAHVELLIEPIERGQGFSFLDRVPEQDRIPARFIGHVETGVIEVAARGFSGFGLTDIAVSVIDGSYHDTDSTPSAFVDAGAMALGSALAQLVPVILEPLLSVTVSVPTKFLGPVFGALNMHRAHVEKTLHHGDTDEVIFVLGQREFGNYQQELPRITQGTGILSFRFARYGELPDALTMKLYCARCEREMVLPEIGGEPYSRTCLICGSDLEPPDSAAVRGAIR
jgi:elongation factor G